MGYTFLSKLKNQFLSFVQPVAEVDDANAGHLNNSYDNSASQKKKLRQRIEQLRSKNHVHRKNEKRLEAECEALDELLWNIFESKDIDRSLLQFIRNNRSSGYRTLARRTAHRLYSGTSKQDIGCIALGTFLLNDEFEKAALSYFYEAGPEKALKYSPVDYLSAQFSQDHNEGKKQLVEFLDSNAESLAHDQFVEILKILAKHREYQIFKDKIDQLADLESVNPQLSEHKRVELNWFVRRMQQFKTTHKNAETNVINLAVMDYKLLDRARTSSNRGDYVQTLATLSNICRFSNVDFTGESELSKFCNQLKQEVVPSRRDQSVSALVRPIQLDRDFSSGRNYPDNTWLICNGWFMHRNYRGSIDFPFPDNVNPIFISFHINDPSVLSEDVVNHLKKYEPIGCRDWTTVYRLREFGVRSFFSGCLTTTIGQIFPNPNKLSSKRIAAVESKVDKNKYHDWEIIDCSQVGDFVRDFTLVEGLEDAYSMLNDYLSYSRIQTSRLHCYLPCRSIGLPVDFRPRNRSDVRFEGLLDLDDVEFRGLRESLESKLEIIIKSILDGKTKHEVMHVWKEICARDVSRADEYCTTFKAPCSHEGISHEVLQGLNCYSTGTDILSSNSSPVELAFALDQNLSSILPVVLMSVHENTTAPLSINVLFRGLNEKYLNALSRLFPTTRFNFFDFSNVTYGDKLRMLPHTTVSTMDRLFLPKVLKDIKKVLYLDTDILVCSDISQLYELDLEGDVIAGKMSCSKSWNTLIKLVTRASLFLEPSDSWNMRRYIHANYPLYSHTFNAGVILMDLEQMRVDKLTENYVGYIRDCKMNDQDVLNLYASGRIKELPSDWNYVPNQDYCKEPKLIHWAGPNKPWIDTHVLMADKFSDVQLRLSEYMKEIDICTTILD